MTTKPTIALFTPDELDDAEVVSYCCGARYDPDIGFCGACHERTSGMRLLACGCTVTDGGAVEIGCKRHEEAEPSICPLCALPCEEEQGFHLACAHREQVRWNAFRQYKETA